eukprot:CAMPEP_0114124710 /NCGR_PEP_ID=MMETSP0043_2-20121206/8921_1 /TAXON_ID=464988 /ORGANISM="Hemiselmis andersenii, Strain CCMP644" /LENGTH=72 /DNA_ID=CAMNT_0001217605 /DNA_START=302 /DNA_END=520 /DNA_ORIENTATION=+
MGCGVSKEGLPHHLQQADGLPPILLESDTRIGLGMTGVVCSEDPENLVSEPGLRTGPYMYSAAASPHPMEVA